jgi:HAD superfamily hydrolase (TIGR01509 family)
MTVVPAAVIFDMDGVLINSEPLWRRAMVKGFAEFGMPVTDDECRSTMGMRFREVIQLWLTRYKKEESLAPAIETRVMHLLLDLIESEGRALEGVFELLDYCEKKSLKCGLATSSSEVLMNAVLAKLGIKKRFQSVVSAEHLKYGKPHPEVFLKCAAELGCSPSACLVIEDSLNGVVAAKAASMRVIAVPDDEQLMANEQRVQQFTLADHRAQNLHEALEIIRSQYAGATVV